MVITISHKNHTPNIRLAAILNVMTKVEILKICKTLDLYVSPNLKKEVTAQRLAEEMLENPLNVLYQFSKTELQVLKQLIEAGANQYVEVKARKTYYKLQKLGLVLTYEDTENDRWYLLMPDEVRESLKVDFPIYLQFAEEGRKGPSPKEIRMWGAMAALHGR